MSNTKMVVSIGHRMVTVVGDEGWCKGVEEVKGVKHPRASRRHMLNH